MEGAYIIIAIVVIYFIYNSIKQNRKTTQNKRTTQNRFQQFKPVVKSHSDVKSDREKENYKIQQDKNKLINNLKKIIKKNEIFNNLRIDELKSVKLFINDNKIKLDDDKILVFLKIDEFIKKITQETETEIQYIINDFDLRRDTDLINKHFYNLNKTIPLAQDYIDVSAVSAGFILPNLISKIKFYNDNSDKLFSGLEEKIITIKFYNSLSFLMLNYLIEDEKLKYFEYYNLFEKLGVFDSTWQNKIYNKLSSIDNSLSKINENLKILNDNIKDVAVEINGLKESLNSKLSDIKSSADVNNIISSIQLYQLYKINKQTKKIN